MSIRQAKERERENTKIKPRLDGRLVFRSFVAMSIHVARESEREEKKATFAGRFFSSSLKVIGMARVSNSISHYQAQSATRLPTHTIFSVEGNRSRCSLLLVQSYRTQNDSNRQADRLGERGRERESSFVGVRSYTSHPLPLHRRRRRRRRRRQQRLLILPVSFFFSSSPSFVSIYRRVGF